MYILKILQKYERMAQSKLTSTLMQTNKKLKCPQNWTRPTRTACVMFINAIDMYKIFYFFGNKQTIQYMSNSRQTQ